MTIMSSPYSTRNQFGKLLEHRGLAGRAVEIGTHRGEFANALLDGWTSPGGHLTCIDPWATVAGYEHQAKFLPESNGDRNQDYVAARKLLSKYGRRVRLTHDVSASFARVCQQGLDFVYIDGDHRYPSVYEDLCIWWNMLKVGGIIAGHDFVCPGEAGGGWAPAVQQAVTDFIKDLPLGNATYVNVIVEEGGLPWSFYIEKTARNAVRKGQPPCHREQTQTLPPNSEFLPENGGKESENSNSRSGASPGSSLLL